jgi:hypothetical protein
LRQDVASFPKTVQKKIFFYFNDSKKQWPNPNLAGRLDNINNELSASNKNIYIDEIQKLYEINLEGNVHVSWTHDVNNSTATQRQLMLNM